MLYSRFGLARCVVGATFLAIACGAVVSLAAEPAEIGAEIGIVAEQPKEGPFVKTPRGFMVPYTTTIPGTEIEFEMLPIPGGTFKLGSPASEAGRKADEGPQVEITVAPFWMGKYEITWDEYQSYMNMVDLFKGFQTHQMRTVTKENKADAVSAPSSLYDPSFTFEKGDSLKLPAVTMSQFAAKQYTKWLSLLTKQTFRLPTEAEWEYACRGGTTTAYSFGDDPAQLDDYGWHTGNSDDTTHEGGQKKPNPWGLYDMHGNVAEWVLDQYTSDGYAALAGKKLDAVAAFQTPTKLFPRVIRGGSWDMKAVACRSAARQTSADEVWTDTDPNEPKSPWWFSDGPSLGVGFRIVRPLDAPPRAEMKRFWDADVERVADDTASRISQGRGSQGLVDPTLPAAIEELQKKRKPRR